MIRTVVLIFLTTISVSGQDSTLVREVCKTFGQIADTADIDPQVIGSFDIIENYLERHPFAGDNPVQEVLRFQYRLGRELKKSCPAYSSDRVRLIPKLVIDLENVLTKQQIDSLDVLTSQVNRDKKVYLYIVTVDNFYPDSTIADFSNRYRDHWTPGELPKKGAVLIVISLTQRQVRISTGDMSMTHLTDKECDEAIKLMMPFFKLGKHFEGLVDGVKAIKSRL